MFGTVQSNCPKARYIIILKYVSKCVYVYVCVYSNEYEYQALLTAITNNQCSILYCKKKLMQLEFAHYRSLPNSTDYIPVQV